MTEPIPTLLVQARTRLDNATRMVSDLCRRRDDPQHREWIMSIPARPDYDPDLVIGDALHDMRRLLAALDATISALAWFAQEAIYKDKCWGDGECNPAPVTWQGQEKAADALAVVERALRGGESASDNEREVE